MARAFAQDHRQNSNLEVKRPYPPATRPVVRKTGGIRVLDKSTGTRRISDSKSSQSDTQALYRRVFYPNSNDVPPRILATPGTEHLDIQLLNLLALICRGFISPWFSKISRDRAFLLEIVRVASHVFRRIEAKLVPATDSEEPIDALKLLCVSISGVLERHIRDYRRAKEMEGSAYAAGVAIPTASSGTPVTSFQALFHSLQPHAAVSSSSAFSSAGSTVPEKLPPYINADYVRALVDNILHEVLPPEDYTAETERAVVTEVIVGIILAGVLNKVSQPWFIHGLIIKFLERNYYGVLDQADENRALPSLPSATRISTFFANLPVLFYRMTAFFTYISFIIVTALATPYSGMTKARHLCRQPISLAFTVIDSAAEGRQVLSQVRWTASTSTIIFGSVLDKYVRIRGIMACVSDLLSQNSHPFLLYPHLYRILSFELPQDRRICSFPKWVSSA